MFVNNVLTSLLALATATTTALAAALPEPQTTGEVPAVPYPTNTTVTFYQGTTSSSSCGIAVAHGTLQAGVCNKILTQGLGIGQKKNGTCVYVEWRGSTSCDGSDITVTPIPRGSGETCIVTGVEDGGVHYLGSGIWTCG